MSAPVTCAHGMPWLSALRYGCLWCATEIEDLCAQFDAAVQAGTYDRDGYTPAERKAA